MEITNKGGYVNNICRYNAKRKLEGKDAVLIKCPKWFGKTTTAEQIAIPQRILTGETPRLIGNLYY